MINGMYFFHPIFTQPARNLRRRYTKGAGLLGDMDQVPGMIAMPMRDKYKIRFDFIDSYIFSKCISGKKRVEQKGLPPRLDGKGRMTVERKLHVSQIFVKNKYPGFLFTHPYFAILAR
jgi:hypothetical protein